MVRHPPLSRALYIRNTETEQDNYYPLPIRITPEDFKVSEQNQDIFQALPKLKADEASECAVRGSL
jgi:hypothetical protein